MTRAERTSIQLQGRVTDGFCVVDATLDASPGPAGIQAVISTATSLSTISPALATELALTPESVAEIRFAGEPDVQTVAVVILRPLAQSAHREARARVMSPTTPLAGAANAGPCVQARSRVASASAPARSP